MAFSDTLDVAPPRVFLTSVSTGSRLEAQYNPTELAETIGATYAKQKVIGLSHQVKQFTNTDDLTHTFTLKFDGTRSIAQQTMNMRARALLHSWCYPRRDANSVGRAGPTRVIFVWPGLVQLTTVILTLAFKYERFNVQMEPIQWEVAVGIEEIRDALLLAEDVLINGTIR